MNQEILRKMAEENICYEVKMLRLTRFLINEVNALIQKAESSGLIPVKEYLVKNTYVESFLLHARNLMEFLYPPKKLKRKKLTTEKLKKNRRETILAKDYLTNWESKKPAIPKVFLEYRKRIHERLAHLSIKRLDGDKTDWPCNEILKMSLEVWRDFLSKLSQLSEDRRKWFQKWDDFIKTLPEEKGSDS